MTQTTDKTRSTLGFPKPHYMTSLLRGTTPGPDIMQQRRIKTASLSTETSATLTAFGDVCVCARGPNRRAIGWFRVLCLQLRATIPSVGLPVGCPQIVVCVCVCVLVSLSPLALSSTDGLAARILRVSQPVKGLQNGGSHIRSYSCGPSWLGSNQHLVLGKEAGRQNVCQSYPCRSSCLSVLPRPRSARSCAPAMPRTALSTCLNTFGRAGFPHGHLGICTHRVGNEATAASQSHIRCVCTVALCKSFHSDSSLDRSWPPPLYST